MLEVHVPAPEEPRLGGAHPAQCGNLTTIYADSSWALPAGVSGMGTFYNDARLVGGNGTAYSSSAYGYARLVVDRAGQSGYLTAS